MHRPWMVLLPPDWVIALDWKLRTGTNESLVDPIIPMQFPIGVKFSDPKLIWQLPHHTD